MVFVDDVPSGLGCGCVCPGCAARLVARKGAIKRHHFAHAHGEGCSSAAESALHLMAKQIILDERQLLVPGTATTAPTMVAYDVSQEEVTYGSGQGSIRADAVVSTRSGSLVVEIAVTHASTSLKYRHLHAWRRNAVEISLAHLCGVVGLTREEMVREVTRTAPRIWLYNARAEDEASRAISLARRDMYEQAAMKEVRKAEQARAQEIDLANALRIWKARPDRSPDLTACPEVFRLWQVFRDRLTGIPEPVGTCYRGSRDIVAAGVLAVATRLRHEPVSLSGLCEALATMGLEKTGCPTDVLLMRFCGQQEVLTRREEVTRLVGHLNRMGLLDGKLSVAPSILQKCLSCLRR